MDNHLTKNIKLWKLFYQRDRREIKEKIFLKNHDYIGMDINRHDDYEKEINEILNN